MTKQEVDDLINILYDQFITEIQKACKCTKNQASDRLHDAYVLYLNTSYSDKKKYRRNGELHTFNDYLTRTLMS